MVRWLAAVVCTLTFSGLAVLEIDSVQVYTTCTCGDMDQCLTLDQALAKVVSDAEIMLAPGLHRLQNFSLLRDIQNVSLKGSSDAAQVRITCNDGVGLGAVNVTSLRLSNMTLEGCSLSGSNLAGVITSLSESVDLFYQVPLEVGVAILLGNCRDFPMENVVVNGTAGIGLLAVNVVGNSSLVGMTAWDGKYCSPTFGDNSKLDRWRGRFSVSRLQTGLRH